MHSRILPGCLIVTGLLFAGGSPPARAHGELHDLIEQVTQDIARSPSQPKLYLERARLHRAHLGWDAAMADLERAASLSNEWHQVHFARAELFLDVEWNRSAVVAVDLFLAHEPNHVAALVLRARAQAKLGEYRAAARDYTRAIGHASPPAPEMFLERAQVLVAADDELLAEALQGLEEGLTRLGPLPTLQQAAIEVELKQNRVDAALARIDSIMTEYPRKEGWLVRRGEILRTAGRLRESAEAYHAALQAWRQLPANLRRVPAMVDLEQRIQAALVELEAGAAAGANP